MQTKHTNKFYGNIKLKWHTDTVHIALILENNDYLTDKILMAVPWGLTVLSQKSSFRSQVNCPLYHANEYCKRKVKNIQVYLDE